MLDAAVDSGAVLEWGSRGVSVRARCPIWSQPITIAWLYPTADQFWLRTRSFSFGAAIFDYEDVPDELLSLLGEWSDTFADDDFAEDASSKGVRAWAVGHDAAVENVDLLTERLQSILSKLAAL